MSQNTKKTTKWITLLGVISCFCVFMLHSNGRFWSLAITDSRWISANVVESLAYFAVACFFMISGATLIDYKERYDTKTYFIHRLKRCVIPYLIWSIFGMTAYFIINPTPGNRVPILIFNFLFLGQQLNYWFFPILFILYLLIPIIANVSDKQNRKKVAFWIVVVGFICTFLIPFIVNVCGNPVSWPFDFNKLVYPLVYACVGYLIKNISLPKWSNIVIWILGLGGLCAIMLGTQFLSMHDGSMNTLFKGYGNWPCFLYALGVAVFIKQISFLLDNVKFVWSISNFLGKFTFTIYLMHTILLMAFGIIYNNYFNIPNSSDIYVWTIGLFILPTIILFTWSLRKIPYVNKALIYVLP